MGCGRRLAALALGVAAAPLAAVVAVPAPASGVPADASTWVVTVAPGAELAVDGTPIGPRDVVVELTPVEAGMLAGLDEVTAVEPDAPAAAADLPADPCLLGPGCAVTGDQRGLRRVGAETAWPVAGGAPGVVVAVVDAGVDTTHPDLAGRVEVVAPGADGCAALDPALGTTDRTASGHGTRVAGLIGAAADGAGIVGVAAGGVRIRAYTALGPDLRGSTAAVAAAIHCAIDDGADVVNLSLTAADTTALRNALDRAAAANVVVVAAAGNGGDGAHPGPYPAAHPSVLAVTAVADGDGGEHRAAFANGGPWVDLGAPGTAVLSTTPGGTWSVASGTSYAAPLVSGAAALARASHPEWGAAEVVERLLASAEPLDDSTVGSGLIDLSAALRSPAPGAPVCPSTTAGWVLDAYGGLHAFGGAPGVASAAYWPGWDIARDLAVAPGVPGGYVLDGYGALHPFGRAPRIDSPAYRPAWDIARAAARRADGSVVVLDGWGGLHVAGGGPALGPGGPWWPGADVARDVAVDPGSPAVAYVLDAYGGVHVAGAGTPAPQVTVSRYTPGRDLARRLLLLPGGGRGYVLDANGRLHPWAVAGRPMPPPIAAATFGGSGRDLAPGVVLGGGGSLVPVGDSPCVPSDRWPGADVARAVAITSSVVSG